MIDTDKYEGRTPGQWSVTSIRDGSIPWNTADEELCADAPLLLQALIDEQAEVKRLREENQRYLDYLVQVADEYTDADGVTYEIYCEFGDEEE
jgi:hypothetical protein